MNVEAESDVSELPIEGIPTGSPPTLAAESGDREFEFSLRLLTGVVTAALIASVGLLAYRWAHKIQSDDAAPVASSAHRPSAPAAAVEKAPARDNEVLMQPNKVFRSEEQSGVPCFSDQSTCGNSQPAKSQR